MSSTTATQVLVPRRLSLLWLLLPATLGVVGIFHHEWWRDEAYTWLVAGSSNTPIELFRNLGFNGHPRAFYILVWLLRQISPNPLSLAISNLGFALAAMFLFSRSAPVTRFQACLFSLSFYPLYQYGIIVRSYSLLIFL